MSEAKSANATRVCQRRANSGTRRAAQTHAAADRKHLGLLSACVGGFRFAHPPYACYFTTTVTPLKASGLFDCRSHQRHAQMAMVQKFSARTMERNSVHREVTATYTIFEYQGKKILQIDSYGSPESEIPGKQSQSLQFDEAGGHALMAILKEAFGDLE